MIFKIVDMSTLLKWNGTNDAHWHISTHFNFRWSQKLWWLPQDLAEIFCCIFFHWLYFFSNWNRFDKTGSVTATTKALHLSYLPLGYHSIFLRALEACLKIRPLHQPLGYHSIMCWGFSAFKYVGIVNNYRWLDN